MIETREAIHLVLEYAAGGSLQQLVTARGRLSEAEVPRDPSSPPNTHTAQCSAPLFPAEPYPDPYPTPTQVAHRDVKPDNLLFTDASRSQV